MSRKLCVTAVDGQTGHLIAELILTDDHFSKKISSVIGLALDPNNENCKLLKKLGATIVPHKPGKEREMVKTLKGMEADTICLIPPAHHDKHDITTELVSATKKAGIANVCLLSSAGCDLADPQKQPHLREFIDIEALVMSTKGDTSTATGHSPVVIRAGFYAENLLLYAPQAQNEGKLPLPIGPTQKFAPIALGDVAKVAAHVLTGHGKHGFDDKHRGQLITLTGPMLASGDELATAASQALDVPMEFENISAAEAKRVLKKQADTDDSEKQYLLEYYQLVKAGKTNYISTLAFHDITHEHPQEPTDFFKTYAQEFSPAKRRKTTK
ncbi:hypothetical protein MMC16_003925 [Acarospora aff. strigata]|nr:hypothetical protein [Acarospora aff. strigata]